MAAQGESYRLAFPSKSKPHISTGLHFPAATAHHVSNTFQASRVYVIVSKSISKTQNFTALQEALGDKIIGVRKGIKPHTPWDDVLEIIQDLRDKEADLIITLGAGSLTDGAKVVSFALSNNATSYDGLQRLTAEAKTPDLVPCSIPIINIPTSLSGGEFSPFAGATDLRTYHKRSFAHPTMGADLIILDPILSISTPARTWLSSGIRSVDHCVEGLCSLDPKSSPESDKSFVDGLRLLVPNLLLTKRNWEDGESRLKEFLGVVEAMRGVDYGVPMGGSHGIGHQLGPLGVGHGETSCIMLPAILKYNHLHGNQKVKDYQQKVLDALWHEETVADLLRKRGLSQETADAGDALHAVISELELPRSLKEVGVTRHQLDALAENCLKDRWLSTNPVPLTEKTQVLEVLEMVIGDSSFKSCLVYS